MDFEAVLISKLESDGATIEIDGNNMKVIRKTKIKSNVEMPIKDYRDKIPELLANYDDVFMEIIM